MSTPLRSLLSVVLQRRTWRTPFSGTYRDYGDVSDGARQQESVTLKCDILGSFIEIYYNKTRLNKLTNLTLFSFIAEVNRIEVLPRTNDDDKRKRAVITVEHMSATSWLVSALKIEIRASRVLD